MVGPAVSSLPGFGIPNACQRAKGIGQVGRGRILSGPPGSHSLGSFVRSLHVPIISPIYIPLLYMFAAHPRFPVKSALTPWYQRRTKCCVQRRFFSENDVQGVHAGHLAPEYVVSRTPIRNGRPWYRMGYRFGRFPIPIPLPHETNLNLYPFSAFQRCYEGLSRAVAGIVSVRQIHPE